MMTKRQEELINSCLGSAGEISGPLYHEIANYLSELGYNPKKEKSTISFKHDLHNKQIAKMGIKISKPKGAFSFFSLRFSACRGYSQRFNDILSAYIVKYPVRSAKCTSNACDYCSGEPSTHVYTHIFPNGESKVHCGAYAIEIPDITAEDIDEIKKLITEEHEYLMEHEASR